MKVNKKLWTCLVGAFSMLVMILDTKTSLFGARDGLELCLATVIPSLFPFFVISGIINSSLSGVSVAILRPIAKFTRIPSGAESFFLLGLMGGYPIGAKNLHSAYLSGCVSKSTAERMIGFCNNAGPAFIFGIVGGMFGKPQIAWMIWLIHVASAFIVGILLPGKAENKCRQIEGNTISIPKILEQSIKSTALVCGWIIIFRVIITFLDHWFLWLLPDTAQVVLIGLLELSNGCCELGRITNDGLRFVVASAILALGGACVTMQVNSVTQGLRLSYYYQGKLLQLLLSTMLSVIFQGLLFADHIEFHYSLVLCITICVGILLTLFLAKPKNDVAIREKMIYNISNSC